MKHPTLDLSRQRGIRLLNAALILGFLVSILFIQPARAASHEINVEFNAPTDTAEVWLDIPDKALLPSDLTVSFSDSTIEIVKTPLGLSARAEAKAGSMTVHVQASKQVKTELVATFADSGKRILAEQFVELSLDAPPTVIPSQPPSSDPDRNPSNDKNISDGVNKPQSSTVQVEDKKRSAVETVQAVDKSSKIGFGADNLAKTGTAVSAAVAILLLLLGTGYGATKIGHKQARRAK